ncbi:MAG: hypothetical protein IJ000_06665 [Paludibacteraceae bacterium]|nr:hypothetical protein [Paludibacteraceae bacterium]
MAKKPFATASAFMAKTNQLLSTMARLRLLLVMFVTLSVSAEVLGAAATLPVDYSFANGKNSLPTGVSQSGLGSDYDSHSPYLLKFDSDNDYLQIQVDAAVDKIIFAVKMIGGNSTSYFQLQGSSDGNTYTDIQKFEIKGKQNDIKNCTTTVVINSSYRYFRFVFDKGSNVGFGKLKITKATVATPTLTVTPTSLAFGTVEKGSTVAAKTFSISGSNLTSGNLSISAPTGYSVSRTSVSVNGTLSSTDITVTPNTSTAGTYNGNITISGGGLTSDVKVEVKMTVLETYTITWIVDGETKHTNSATYGGSVTAPNVDEIPCGDVIAGWTDAKNGEYIHETSTLYEGAKANITNITSDITFYAVFADYAD